MNRGQKLAVLYALLITLAGVLAACGGVPKDVKDALDSRIPGSQIRSVQKAKMPAGDSAAEGWCVVTEKGGIKTNWVVLKQTVGENDLLSLFQGADKQMLSRYGCSK